MKEIIITIVAILTSFGMTGCSNGVKESKDAATSATVRDAFDEIVTIIE